MKKHLSLFLLLMLSACTGPANSSVSSSVEQSSSTSSETTTSIEASSSSVSSTTSSSLESSSSSASSSSSVVSSSSSSSEISSSSSSSSSSHGGEDFLSPMEAFNLFFEKLQLKNSTLIDETYIEQKIINDRALTNHYYGKFASQNDDGYFMYHDQGLYHYSIIENEIVIDNCSSVNSKTSPCEYFCTAHDFLTYKEAWKPSKEDYVFTTKDEAVGDLISMLDGKGSYEGFAESYDSTFTISNDGEVGSFTTIVDCGTYGSLTAQFIIKDLGKTTDDKITTFLETAPRLVSDGHYPNDVQDAIETMMGYRLDAPAQASYAHYSSIYKDENGIPTSITYEDFLSGDCVSDYCKCLEENEFALSDMTDIKSDLKKYGYGRYYYEKDYYEDIVIVAELYFVPNILFNGYEKTLYLNGIMHIRFALASKS